MAINVSVINSQPINGDSTATVTIEGVVTATSTAAANLTGIAEFTGISAGSSTAVASFAANSNAVGESLGIASAAATFEALGEFVSTCTVVSSPLGAVNSFTINSGPINSGSSPEIVCGGTSAAHAMVAIEAHTSGTATATANILASATFTGTISAYAEASSLLEATAELLASVEGTSAASAAIQLVELTTGEASGTSTAASTFTHVTQAVGICAGVCTVTGEIYAVPVNRSVGIPVPTPRVRGPLREYWLRSNKFSALEGPYTYYEAEHKARTATREAARTGRGDISLELVTIVGTRVGDPNVPHHLRVVALYLAGRKTTGGSLAQYNSDRGNT